MREDDSKGGREWASTLWSTVLRARDRDPAALERLCARYWRAIYHYILCRRRDRESAQDLTQAFLLYVIEKDLLSRKDPEHGSFRGFLRASVDRFLSDQYDHERALKRGGGLRRIDLDFAKAEIDASENPERAFLRSYAAETLARVLERCGREWPPDQVRALRLRFGFDGERPSYAEIAHDLGVSESDVTNLVHRAKERFRELLIEEVRETVSSAEDLQSELRFLRQIL